jgi:hypothetical protein
MQSGNSAWCFGALLGVAVVVISTGSSARQEVAVVDAQGSSRQPVLVELFTSEGCSSCPPADSLIAKLDELQPIPGARAIVLSEHVTYWDHEGWRDPYSLDVVTNRQRWYRDKFGLSDVYTPQAVVDGVVQMNGSDARQLTQAISTAAATPKEELKIDNATWAEDGVRFDIDCQGAAAGKSRSTLVAILAEDATETAVKSGENAGKTLRNVAVVRALEEIGSDVGDGRTLILKLPTDKEKRATQPLRLVVFLADKRTGHVLRVAEQMVPRS